jgi:hypothetical protein
MIPDFDDTPKEYARSIVRHHCPEMSDAEKEELEGAIKEALLDWGEIIAGVMK